MRRVTSHFQTPDTRFSAFARMCKANSCKKKRTMQHQSWPKKRGQEVRHFARSFQRFSDFIFIFSTGGVSAKRLKYRVTFSKHRPSTWIKSDTCEAVVRADHPFKSIWYIFTRSFIYEIFGDSHPRRIQLHVTQMNTSQWHRSWQDLQVHETSSFDPKNPPIFPL